MSMRAPLILAVDIGTSGARALLFDERAQPGFQVRDSVATGYPQPGWAELDADAVVASVTKVLRSAVAAIPAQASLEAVVLSTQLYSLLAVDAEGQPLTPVLTWADMRATESAATLRQSASALLAPRTGCPTQAIYPLAKIHWLRQHGDLPGTVRYVSIKDYVVFRLTGRWITDWSTASASGLLDITRKIWDDEALTLAGINTSALPELSSPRTILREWRADVRASVGIREHLPLILGAGDAPLANIGAGATMPGTLAINLGTSAAARALIAQPATDPAGHLWTYVADVDRWVIGGIVGSGGIVIDWLLKDLLGHKADEASDTLFEDAERLASAVAPGADDLLFIPYLSGEQSPDWNPSAKGLLYGLTLRHQTGHVFRAALEGLAFALLRIVRRVETLHGTATRASFVTGGLSASPLMQATLADVLGRPVIVPPSPESSSRGAAILGWLTLGLAESYESFAQPGTKIVPYDLHHALYEKRYKAFCLLNQQLQKLNLSQENPA